MVTIDGSIVLIAMPDIFRGIELDPLLPGNSFYLLWMILGFLVVTSVLVVSLGRLGDMYGRVRIYNLGLRHLHVLFHAAHRDLDAGRAGAIFLIVGRIFQGVGGAMLFANSAAILTDAFPGQPAGHGPRDQRGGRHQRDVHRAGGRRAAGPDQLAPDLPGVRPDRAVLHGLGLPDALRPDAAPQDEDRLGRQHHLRGRTDRHHDRHHLRDRALPPPHHGLDQPVRRHRPRRRRRAPDRLRHHRDSHTSEPMFRLPLFRIRAFTAGTLASFLSSVGRGGLMFMLIIWLQGIWLPLHGYDFAQHAAVGRHLHAAADHRVLHRRPHLGGAVRPVRGPPFATGGMLSHGPGLLPARAAARSTSATGSSPPCC